MGSMNTPAMLESLLGADTRGVEIAGRVALGGAWQVDGSFSAFHLTPHPDAASHDATTPTYDGHAPTYQWRGHSALSLGPRATADVLLFYVGSLGQLGVPAYTRADGRFEWKLTRHVSVSARGHNLLSPAHAEFASDQTIESTRVPRGGNLRLTWRF
jgi:outer membrane receptor protein involved in Fe transport